MLFLNIKFRQICILSVLVLLFDDLMTLENQDIIQKSINPIDAKYLLAQLLQLVACPT